MRRAVHVASLLCCRVPTLYSYWFEKFHWFVSSENYLVISGRDASQANGGRLHSMRTCAGTGPHLRRNVSPRSVLGVPLRSAARHGTAL